MADTDSAPPSFDASGLTRIVGGKAILAEVRSCVRSLRPGSPAQPFLLREPNLRAFSGSDSLLTVPLDHGTLMTLAERWLGAGGIRARVAGEIVNAFTDVMTFDEAVSRSAADAQVDTRWRRATSLSIDTLEWMACDSDVIVRGTIDDLALTQLGNPEDKSDYYATLDRHLVRLNVRERLKGHCGEQISFELVNGGKLKAWKRAKTELVVFLKDRGIPADRGPMRMVAATYALKTPVLRYAGRSTDSKTLIAMDDPDHPKQFSAELEWTGDTRKMLAIVRNYLSHVGGETGRRSPSYVSFRPSASRLKGSWWEDEPHARMRFPIDPYLEKRARRWIRSPKKEDRHLGAYALVYFRSPDNAELLKGLLADPGRWPDSQRVSIYSQRRVRYLARWEAWSVLKAWGYDVAVPAF